MFTQLLINTTDGRFSVLRSVIPAVLTALLVSLLMFIGGCSSDSGDDSGPNSSTGGSDLTVNSMTPGDGATDVSPHVSVSATFSGQLYPSTVTSSSFYIQGVSGTASAAGATATFTPSSPLSENSTYTLVATSAIHDMNGKALASDQMISFTTGVAPVADAGENQDVVAGGMLSLAGNSNLSGTVNYIWTQISGPMVGALNGQFPSIMAPDTVSTLVFTLQVDNGSGPSAPDTTVVFVLGDSDGSIWVHPSGNDANEGSRTAPMAGIQAAIDKSVGMAGNPDIYVAGGTYGGSITLAADVSIYGGYDPSNWLRDVGVWETLIKGGPTAVFGEDADNVVLDGLFITSADATGPGESSYGIRLVSSRGVEISRNTIWAGNGADGSTPDRPGKRGDANNGSKGTNAGGCLTPNTGGSGGSGSGRAGGKGGTGGAAGGKDGGGGQGPCGGGGDGGFASSGKGGGGGCDGGAGDHASNGGAEFGAVNDVEGLYDPATGWRGSSGSSGGGGGGGGGGAGSLLGCGGGGGGGGAGGLGGTGGYGGQGGGGSFGILLADSSDAHIVDVSITTTDGGLGGNGSLGGVGGDGGSGGNGGSSATGGWAGGKGGTGGDGGTGGAGGGGGGGPTIGIVEQNSTSFQDRVSFTLGNAGGPGQGGHAEASGGAIGLQAEVKKIQ